MNQIFNLIKIIIQNKQMHKNKIYNHFLKLINLIMNGRQINSNFLKIINLKMNKKIMIKNLQLNRRL